MVMKNEEFLEKYEILEKNKQYKKKKKNDSEHIYK